MFGLERGLSLADIVRRRRAEAADEQRVVDEALHDAQELLQRAKAGRSDTPHPKTRVDPKHGHTQQMKAADRAKRPPQPAPSRRQVAMLNAEFALWYGLILGGGILGWLAGHTWLTLGIGAGLGGASGLVLYPVVLGVAFLVRSVRRSRS